MAGTETGLIGVLSTKWGCSHSCQAFRECPGDLEQSEFVPVFGFQGLAQPFCYGPSRSHQWSREEAAFLGVP